MPGSTSSAAASRFSPPELVDSPTQLDVQGPGGSTVQSSVTLFNASSATQRVFGTYRVLGGESSFGRPVTQRVSAPPAGSPIPAQGATAASPVKFTVPRGVDVLDADMRWPDPTNSDEQHPDVHPDRPGRGKLAQFSYDYGAANGPNSSPDIQHSTVEHPMAGTWTAQIVWADGRGHVQSPPNTPGPYNGAVTFQASGRTSRQAPRRSPSPSGLTAR